MWSPFGSFWSVKYLLASRHPELKIHVLSLEGSQKKVSWTIGIIQQKCPSWTDHCFQTDKADRMRTKSTKATKWYKVNHSSILVQLLSREIQRERSRQRSREKERDRPIKIVVFVKSKSDL